MALVTHYDGNQGVFGYVNIQDFDPVVMTATAFRAEYDGSRGPYDATRSPFAYELVLANAELYTFETGPEAGEETYAGGSIKGVNFFDDAGKLLVSISDINVDLSFFMANLLRDQGYQLYDYFIQKGATFTGSNDSSGPLRDDWDGDDIDTGKGKDKVLARGGDDYIKDGGGADAYDGGKGWDTLTYNEWFWQPLGARSGIVADLAKGTIRGPDGFVDTVKNIEEVEGTFLKDTLLGNSFDNNFSGFQGRDVIDGRKGYDIVNYRGDADQGGFDGIKADLSAGTIRDGFGHRDTVKSIEGVRGTNTDDEFIDNGKGNYFRGRNGDDTYTITRGNDTINDRDGGADFFRFIGDDFGYNFIDGFDQDGGERDLIFIEGVSGLGDLNIFQDGDNAIIETGRGAIQLNNFNAANLGAADFQFDIA